jgi:hypothetical protein
MKLYHWCLTPTSVAFQLYRDAFQLYRDVKQITLIDWYLTPTLAVFQLYRGVKQIILIDW